jgi:hypothetical protein
VHWKLKGARFTARAVLAWSELSRLAAITNDSPRTRAKGTYRAIDTAGNGTYCQEALQIVIGTWGSGVSRRSHGAKSHCRCGTGHFPPFVTVNPVRRRQALGRARSSRSFGLLGE